MAQNVAFSSPPPMLLWSHPVCAHRNIKWRGAKRESKGEAAVKPLASLDSRPNTADGDDGGVWGADSPDMTMMRPTPPDSRPNSQHGSARPSRASTVSGAKIGDFQRVFA